MLATGFVPRTAPPPRLQSRFVRDVVVRRFQPGDGLGISRISLENGAYYARIAPEHFKQPDAEGLAELIEDDSEWRESDANLALVAEVTREIAGYLEASVHPPMETARWQSQRDLGGPRLFINYVGTGDAFKRMGVATRLVEAAEAWGRSKGAVAAVCDTYIDSPLSVPFWEERMGYSRRAIIFRKAL
jgi:ribosomal protein S18 acetylase RimI-like enzyme